MMLINLAAFLNSAYSYGGLFLLAFASSVVPVPEIELLVASFAAFATSVDGLIYLILLVLAATVLGDLSAYFITRRFSDKLEKWMKKFRWYSKHEEKYRAKFNEYGFIFVFLTRFLITGAGLVVNYVSGFEKMDKKKFISAVILGQLVAALLYTLIGYIFKDTWTEFLNFVQSSFLAFFAFLIFIFLAYMAVKSYNKRSALANN